MIFSIGIVLIIVSVFIHALYGNPDWYPKLNKADVITGCFFIIGVIFIVISILIWSWRHLP